MTAMKKAKGNKRAGPGRPELGEGEKLVVFAGRMRPPIHNVVKSHSQKNKVTYCTTYRYLVEWAIREGALRHFRDWTAGLKHGYQFPDREQPLVEVVDA